MSLANYGVGKILIEGEEKEHVSVHFGDGKTRIFSLTWPGGVVGVKMCAIKEDLEPFSRHEYDEENPPHTPKGDSVYLIFDNPKSIDALMRHLECIKAYI